MSFDHPFRESRLNESRNFRPEWDIPELNQTVTSWLVAEVARLRGRKEPDPGQMIAAVTGPPGYGKTHLFGRIEHQIGHEVFFVFVPAFDEQTPPLDHIRRYVIEALFEPVAGGPSPLEKTLARICQPALSAYFLGLPPTLAARHETMSRRLSESADAVLEVVRQVKTLEPFRRLADSLVQIFPQNAAIVRALALGWAPAPWSGLARRWLQGQDLADADRALLGLSEEPPLSLDVLRALPPLFDYDRPMLICCDQIEGLLMGDSADRISRFTATLMDLVHAVPAQIVLSCFLDSWNELLQSGFTAFKMRVRQPVFKLEAMKADQAVRLVQGRMASWSGRTADQAATWPFAANSVELFVRKHTPTPRGLIQVCARQFDEWVEEGQGGEILITEVVGPVPDATSAFLKEWNREIEAIARDPKKDAANMDEDRLYKGVYEAIKLAHSAQRMREFGGVRIVDVRDKVIKATPPLRRPGAAITLAGKPGQDAQTIVVALTTVEASKSLSSYFRALFIAAEPLVGAVLIHPKRDLDTVGVTRAKVDAEVKAGRLRIMALEDYKQTHHATECLVTLLDRAEARELVINGVTLSAEDCRDLVIKTGVIDHLDLFKMLGGWKRPTPAVVASTVPLAVSDVPPETSAVAVASTPKSVPSPPVTKVLEPDAPTQPVAPKPGKADQEAWSAEKLAGAVRKLNLLGQNVEPDGFEVGPTFVRLKVRPIGKTNFRGVCNKAVDLRISLGLKVTPIVGSQAGCISIDVQRLESDTVTLADALVDPPANLAGQPAFPVGQDVAGQTHWLNLGEPADCHLLVAGTTGSGKSEFLRALIATLATRLTPDRLQFVLIDPKRVTFNLSGSSPYLKSPVAYGLDEALPLIEACMAEMDRRYKILEEKKLSNVGELPPELVPRIILVIDEFASFLEDKESKKVVTALLKRIGAMARAAGIHLILSTQRPDKDVVTPLLRENLPGRIALRVASRAGSDLILGSSDAELLLGRGDLFWKRGGELLRLQSPYVSQAELERKLLCTK